jgi:hypothetical protein
MAVAQAIYVANFGYAPPESMPNFVRQVFTTPEGWTLIVVGNGVGFLFAVLVLTMCVVSFPLLLDRDVGAAVAILRSVRVVLRNPVTMAIWGLIVAGLLLIGSLPLFMGLAVVMPVLGHSTWHLYRKWWSQTQALNKKSQLRRPAGADAMRHSFRLLSSRGRMSRRYRARQKGPGSRPGLRHSQRIVCRPAKGRSVIHPARRHGRRGPTPSKAQVRFKKSTPMIRLLHVSRMERTFSTASANLRTIAFSFKRVPIT